MLRKRVRETTKNPGAAEASLTTPSFLGEEKEEEGRVMREERREELWSGMEGAHEKGAVARLWPAPVVFVMGSWRVR